MFKKTAGFFFIFFTISFGISWAGNKELKLEVPSALLMEPRTGTILYEKDADIRLTPASLVKMMTLYLTFEHMRNYRIDPSSEVSISRKASRVGGRQIYLKEREKITLDALIKSAAVFSANDAAYALAELVAGTEDQFVEMMNDKADELGLSNTHFCNSHGLPETDPDRKQYTTARDLALLARWIMVDCPEVFAYTQIQDDTIRDGAFSLVNTNDLLKQRDDVYGLKTGFVQTAGYCVVITANRSNFHLIAVVMGARTKPARFLLASRMLDFGFSNYKLISIDSLPAAKTVPVFLADQESVGVKLAAPIEMLVGRDQNRQPEFGYSLPESLEAPIPYLKRIGWVTISFSDSAKVVAPLIVEQDVPKTNSWWKKIVYKFF
ncbi:MAG: D-alanyl-D-alanine carboxypeptidase [bacterium]|nr:D-alanyl-D-alanine carboxypeptidase [bacterium]